MISHLIRLAHSALREASKRRTRSSHWPAVEKAHLLAHPTCAGCGTTKHLQTHHIKPFHLDPTLELDPTNLVTACMDTPECHLRICHGSDFKAFNLNVLTDLAQALASPGSREEIWARAKSVRQFSILK